MRTPRIHALMIGILMVMWMPLIYSEPSVALYIPAFDSPSESALGLNVANVFNLATWRTLRKAPFPNPQRLSFGNGTIIWDNRSFKDAEAIDVAKSQGAQLVLWGNAFRYGSGAVANAYLSVVSDERGDAQYQQWYVQVTTDQDSVRVSMGVFPEHAFTFLPLAINADLLSKLASPSFLDLHTKPRSKEIVGKIAGDFVAIEQTDQYAHVKTSDGQIGYISLPPASLGASSVSNFAGALMRVLRTDWQGAEDLFLRIEADSQHQATSVLIDSYILHAYCLEQEGLSGKKMIDQALQLNPLSVRARRYLVMVQLADIVRAVATNESPKLIAELLISNTRAIESLAKSADETDPWLRDVRRAQAALSKLVPQQVAALTTATSGK